MMGALDGLRVVELGSGVAAAFCARLFADLGAQVLKVEAPGGDLTREAGPFPQGVSDPDRSALFHYLNAGKLGCTRDLDSAADSDRLDDTLSRADILVENLPFGERRQWGLDFESLAERHPHLIVVSISAYGRSGEWAELDGTDLTAQAASSLPLGLGSKDHSPLRLPFEQAEYQAAFHGAAAALCALRERRTSGLGQGIDIAVAQVIGYLVGGMYLVTAKGGSRWERKGTLMGGAPYPTGFFECGDGFVCIASQTPKQWEAFLSLMDNPKWSKEKNADNAIYLGLVDAKPAHGHFQEWLKTYTRRELLEMAAAEGIVMGVAQTVDEVLASEQYAFRGLWAELPLGDTTVRIPKPGYLLSATPTAVSGPGPTLGADDDLEGSRDPDGAGSLDGAAERGSRGANSESPAATGTRRRSLDGVRVLDFGWNWAGPMAGQLLADMGADVIRIETSKRQDLMRFLDYTSFFFCHNNRSKRSATFNVADPEGSRLVRELAKEADIVLDNFAAGVMAKNGLGHEELRRDNPGLIVVSMSMAGQEGPLRGMRGFASIATGYSGLELMIGYPDEGVSTGLLPFGLGDVTMAVQAVIGSLAALEHRERTGEGQFVDVSQIDSAAATMGEPLLDFQLAGVVAGPQGNLQPKMYPHGLFPTSGEDRWVALAVRDSRDWAALCDVIGKPAWASDPVMQTSDGRRSNGSEIERAIADWSRARERDEAVEELRGAGVPCAPVLELEERDALPHWQERGFLLTHDEGEFDPCTVYSTPWLMTATPPVMTRPTPQLGEHNIDVYMNLLGLEETEIQKLVEAGVLT